jgi:hypothetical protein
MLKLCQMIGVVGGGGGLVGWLLELMGRESTVLQLCRVHRLGGGCKHHQGRLRLPCFCEAIKG